MKEAIFLRPVVIRHSPHVDHTDVELNVNFPSHDSGNRCDDWSHLKFLRVQLKRIPLYFERLLIRVWERSSDTMDYI
jgi:hypothetical protein